MLKSCVLQLNTFARSYIIRSCCIMDQTMTSEEEIVHENVLHIIDLVRKHSYDEAADKQRCKLVAVSKTKSANLIRACYEVGQRHFGENYVQELSEKSTCLAEQCPEIKWHYIGQIQSNKIPKITSATGLHCVETLESQKHCDLFEKEMEKKNSTLNVLIQVNTSEEEQKGGLLADDALKLASYVTENCPHLKMAGFMTIGAFDHSNKVPNPDFDKLFEVRRKWATQIGKDENDFELSMGMSEDFITAIEQGSTNVRVGSKIFGPRLYKK